LNQCAINAHGSWPWRERKALSSRGSSRADFPSLAARIQWGERVVLRTCKGGERPVGRRKKRHIIPLRSPQRFRSTMGPWEMK
jgi:hypothetical protein